MAFGLYLAEVGVVVIRLKEYCCVGLAESPTALADDPIAGWIAARRAGNASPFRQEHWHSHLNGALSEPWMRRAVRLTWC